VLEVFGDRVAVEDAEAAVHGDVGVCLEAMAAPAGADLTDIDHARGVDGDGVDLVEHVRFHAVHQAPQRGAQGADQDPQDREGDEEADDGVRLGETEPDSDDTDDDGDGGESVGLGVLSLGDQRCRSDPFAGADAVDRDEFVARGTYATGDENPPQFGEGSWVEEGIYGFPDDDRGGDGDDQ
jgi:hypothetical protein